MYVKKKQVLVSEHNSLGDGRYFDTASQTSFQVDHASQVCWDEMHDNMKSR